MRQGWTSASGGRERRLHGTPFRAGGGFLLPAAPPTLRRCASRRSGRPDCRARGTRSGWRRRAPRRRRSRARCCGRRRRPTCCPAKFRKGLPILESRLVASYTRAKTKVRLYLVRTTDGMLCNVMLVDDRATGTGCRLPTTFFGLTGLAPAAVSGRFFAGVAAERGGVDGRDRAQGRPAPDQALAGSRVHRRLLRAGRVRVRGRLRRVARRERDGALAAPSGSRLAAGACPRFSPRPRWRRGPRRGCSRGASRARRRRGSR